MPLVRVAAAGLVLLAVWVAWAGFAHTPVYVVSPLARVEVKNIEFPVEPLDTGKVLSSTIALGRKVEVGEVLLVIDSSLEEQRLKEKKLELVLLESKAATLRDQVKLYERVVETQARLTAAQEEEVQIRTSAAASALSRAEGMNNISRRLAQEHLTSALQHLSSENATLQQRDMLAVARSQATQAQISRTLEGEKAALQLSDVRKQVAELEGQAAMAREVIRTLELEIARRTLRASASGVLGDVTPLQVGMVVGPGKPVANIIPASDLRVVASFTPSDAVGRIRKGQKAYFRFDGFPWTQYGIPEGTVRAVASETRERTIRVELDLKRDTASRIPLQHGLTASVEIQIEQGSPWTMLLRSLGAMTRPPAQQDGVGAAAQ